MISQSSTRVQAIKNKFENLGVEPLPIKKIQLCKQENEACSSKNKENKSANYIKSADSSDSDWSPKASPNTSYLYSKSDVKRNLSETKKALSRQVSDPGKKLHRSHAFRCDRSQKLVSPKRHGSCYGRSETGDFTLKMGEKKLSKDRLKKLGNLLEDQMKKEGFMPSCSNQISDENLENRDEVIQIIEPDNEVILPVNSIPDSEVPQHILDQYAKVIKPRKNDDNHEKQDGMTDSGVSSETENIEDEKSNKVKKLLSQFEKNDSTDSEKSNLELMTEFCASSDTIKLEKKNPHIKITDTLKKALKQPLPAGPPPKKPPRTFASIPESPEKQKKDTKKMLEKLEQVLQKRESANQGTLKNEYDIAEADLSLKRSDCNLKKEPSFDKTETLTLKKPKEIHYLCTELIDIPHRQLIPNQLSLNSCFKSLNCAIVPTTNSTLSLPYTRLSTGSRSSEHFCSCSAENLNQNRRLSTFSAENCSKCDVKDTKPDRFSTFLQEKCTKCQINDEKHGFKCHLNCKCRGEGPNFFVAKEKEHIYDIPFIGNDDIATLRSKASVYGSLNQSKSMEDLRTSCNDEDQKIYDIPCEISRPATPEMPDEDTPVDTSPKITSFTEKVKENSPKITSFTEKSKEDSPKITSFNDKSKKDSPEITSFTPKDDSFKVSSVAEKTYNIKTNQGHKSPESENRSVSFDTSPNSETGPKIVDYSPKSPEKRAKSIQKPSKLEFQKLRQSFESGFQKTDDRISEIDTSPINNLENKTNLQLTYTKSAVVEKTKLEKPPMKPKPLFVKNKMSKSSENLVDDNNMKKDKRDKRFSTDGRRYRRDRDASLLPRKDNTQLDVDRENLNRLMNEIYATVTAADEMDNKPSSFPTDGEDGSTSEDSVKLTRSLTEKRKNYVRRVSSKVAYLDQRNKTRFRHQTSVCSYKSEIIDSNPYSTFRSWKSFRTSQKNLNKMADSRSIDSKCNLTDSSGNLLSMKDDFDTFDSSETIDKSSIDEKTGCVDIGLPFEPRDRGLFNVCLLVGLNHMTGQAYVKSVFPSQVQVPPHIENLIFPETLSDTKGEWTADGKGTQCYSLVLTDERGERSYGYCRRVLPEGATTCLPLCYCLIGKYRAPGFYYKVLQEIESHHGSSEVEIHSILQQLFETDFPNPGEEISITYKPTNELHRTINYDLRYSINLGDISKCKTLPNMRRSLGKSDAKDNDKKVTEVCKSGVKDTSDKCKSEDENCKSSVKVTQDKKVASVKSDGKVSKDVSEKCKSESNKDLSSSEMFIKSETASSKWQFHDLENNNDRAVLLLSLDGLRTKTIKRPIEPRIDEDNMSTLLDSLGAGLTIKVFSSLLLERKVLIIGNQLSQVSSCIEALQSALYPLVWQQPLISTIPAEIQRDVLEAPLPILAGMLKIGDLDTSGVSFEEGMLIDLTHPSKVLFYQGDESTILPTSSYKSLKTSLQMESKKQEDDKTRNVLISEAFMRFFVDILGDFWRYFHKGELAEGMLGKGNVVFDKDVIIKSSSSKQNQYFLEWFTETAMFNHFIQNMATEYHNNISTNSLTSIGFVDSPLPDFYDLFQDRVSNRKSVRKNSVSEKNNYKFAVNKKVKLLKTKLRELVT